MSHLKVLFSSQAAKAWIAGLVTIIGAYLIPLISDWLATLTPEMVSAWFAQYGVSLDYGLATVVVGVLGVVWTYLVPNRRVK